MKVNNLDNINIDNIIYDDVMNNEINNYKNYKNLS